MRYIGGLGLTWGPVEQHVPEGSPMQLRVGGGSCQGPHLLLQQGSHDHVAEVSAYLLVALLGRPPPAKQAPDGGFPD